MIGVLAKPSENRAVQEFFELFKTPWEFYQPGKRYDLVIVTRDEVPAELDAAAVVIYQSGAISFDVDFGLMTTVQSGSSWVEWQGTEFPVYGNLSVFRSLVQPLIKMTATSEIVGGVLTSSKWTAVRIGFDLFSEVAFLMTQGQPAKNAHLATLDIHISLLRAIMVNLGIPFVEVPPVPAGYDFVGCLTHDVDFVGIRDHKWDRTLWGFLYRATLGSLIRVLKGRLSWSKCLQNWLAALSIPFVQLGLLEDFWLEFDRYTAIERDLGSTFFFIPFKSTPGTLGAAPAPTWRAAKYDFIGIKGHVLQLLKDGCEIGLHGIDAWQNVQSAKSEKNRIGEVTGLSEIGTRMHWLYWKQESPKILEDAGFTYDSTFGYNDAIGFRAGTAQAFCPLNAENLLELPLNIQDSAMFYSDRMMLSETEALNACKELIDSMSLFGGALTVNWHTRSLSPERQWGDFYANLLNEIKKHRVWFGTATEVVEWFRRRRTLRFDSVDFEDNRVRVVLSSAEQSSDISFMVRVHNPRVASNGTLLPLCLPIHANNQWSVEQVLETPYY